MSVQAHREAIAALIAEVPTAGRVHAYERYVRDETKFRETFIFEAPDLAGKHVRGWWLRNTTISERELGVSRLLVEYTWQVRGFMSLQDEFGTEQLFDNAIDSIRAAYRANPTLGGLSTAESTQSNEFGFQKLDAGPVLFCGVLCHSATLQLRTQEYL